MGIMVLSLALGTQAKSATIQAAYQCKLTTAPADAPDWKTQSFNLLNTSEGFAVVEGGSHIFELQEVDQSQLPGWPQLPGSYYRGNNDIFAVAISPDGITAHVVKPLETDPNSNQRPSFYDCVQIM